MAGGGEAERGRATSPLPPALMNMTGEDTAQDQERQLRDMQEHQALILAQVKDMLASMPPSDPQQANATPEQTQREQKRRQLIKLLAEIERRINTENARPKKRYISPATREAAYAVYYDKLRRAIEDRGTENFPQQGGKKLYGELMMTVTVDATGHVRETEIEQSSGNPTLDRQARAIVRSAAPFGPFDKEMRRQSDLIVVVSHFKFTRDDTLETKLSPTNTLHTP
jgi:protein TonB